MSLYEAYSVQTYQQTIKECCESSKQEFDPLQVEIDL